MSFDFRQRTNPALCGTCTSLKLRQNHAADGWRRTTLTMTPTPKRDPTTRARKIKTAKPIYFSKLKSRTPNDRKTNNQVLVVE